MRLAALFQWDIRVQCCLREPTPLAPDRDPGEHERRGRPEPFAQATRGAARRQGDVGPSGEDERTPIVHDRKLRAEGHVAHARPCGSAFPRDAMHWGVHDEGEATPQRPLHLELRGRALAVRASRVEVVGAELPLEVRVLRVERVDEMRPRTPVGVDPTVVLLVYVMLGPAHCRGETNGCGGSHEKPAHESPTLYLVG